MTQAPTPGPLSADSSYISGCVIVPRTGDPVLFTADNNGVVTVRLNQYAIVPLEDYGNSLPCLAPTAPVEASGSERDALHPDAQPFMHYPDLALHIERMAMSGVVGSGISWDAFLHELNKALRPQPSGETREAVQKLLEEAEDFTDRMTGQPWACEIIERLVEVITTPAPVALGGQHSGEDGLQEAVAHMSWMRKFVPCVFDVTEERLEEIDTFISEKENLSTTPARAEAQDEGAAGEWSEKWSGPCTVGNMIANLRTLPPEMPIYTAYHIPMAGEPSLLRVKRPTMSRERVDGITIKTGDESVPYSAVIWTQPQNPLEAHPSPTPAADADRVREALKLSVDALFDLKAAFVKPGTYDGAKGKAIKQAHVAHRSALAALKSTAAKEGEKS